MSEPRSQTGAREVKILGGDPVKAYLDRREITLKPLRTFTIALEVREVESTIPCGLQTEWGDAIEPATGEVVARAFAGAGWGSPWMTFEVAGRANLCANIGEVLAALVIAVEERAFERPDWWV